MDVAVLDGNHAGRQACGLDERVARTARCSSAAEGLPEAITAPCVNTATYRERQLRGGVSSGGNGRDGHGKRHDLWLRSQVIAGGTPLPDNTRTIDAQRGQLPACDRDNAREIRNRSRGKCAGTAEAELFDAVVAPCQERPVGQHRRRVPLACSDGHHVGKSRDDHGRERGVCVPQAENPIHALTKRQHGAIREPHERVPRTCST